MDCSEDTLLRDDHIYDTDSKTANLTRVVAKASSTVRGARAANPSGQVRQTQDSQHDGQSQASDKATSLSSQPKVSAPSKAETIPNSPIPTSRDAKEAFAGAGK